MAEIDVVNGEALAALGRGREIKVLLDTRKIYFAYLNVQHTEMERSVFGLDGSLRRTVAGYVKPATRTVELRACQAIPPERMRLLFEDLQGLAVLAPLAGYQFRYGTTLLGVFRAQAEPKGGGGGQSEDDGPVVFDLDAPV